AHVYAAARNDLRPFGATVAAAAGSHARRYSGTQSEDARNLEESGVSTLAVVKKGSAMNTNHVIRSVTTPALVFILISAAFAGGWAIVTLDDFPEYAVAGKPLNLTFAVRQHGMTLLPGLHPTLRSTTPTGHTSNANV